MKRFIISLILLAMMGISCQKKHHIDQKDIQNIVFQGKYVGRGCWPVIQVIEPSLSTLGLDTKKTIWPRKLGSNNDSLYHNAIGAGPIPDTFTHGSTFYFTVSKIESPPNIITNGNCLRTIYFLEIKTISFSKD